MSNFKKVLIPTIIIFAVYVIYIFSPTDELGSFENIRAGGEMKQNINVLVVPEKGFERDRNNNIISFIAKDRTGEEAIISMEKPFTEDLSNAEKVELLGHMHGNNFKALSATIIKYKE